MHLNRPCQTRSSLADIKSNEPINYPFNVSFDNGVESHKTIDGLYTRVCVSDKVKNVKIWM